MSAFKLFDPYSLRARLFPAVFASVPILVALAALIPWRRLSWAHGFAAVAVPVILFAAADIARRGGKRRELDLYKKWGGMPTTRMLRHRDETLDAETKDSYLKFLAGKIGTAPPTAEDEVRDSAKADACYARCAGWLRENTRNTKKFAILFGENVTYGYRRNLLALKVISLIADAVVLVGAATALAYWRPNAESELTLKLSIVMGTAILHAVVLSVAVNKKSVKEASEAYARQLLLSCEALMSAPAKPASKAQKRIAV